MPETSEPHYADGKICYIELPSREAAESARFYATVFNWNIRTRDDGMVSFDDAAGEVSGTWRTDRPPVAGFGMLIHIMVFNIVETMQKITANGGTIVQPVGKDLPEITAHFADPSGNVLGLYQQAV